MIEIHCHGFKQMSPDTREAIARMIQLTKDHYGGSPQSGEVVCSKAKRMGQTAERSERRNKEIGGGEAV